MNKKYIGIGIFILLIGLIVGIKFIGDKNDGASTNITTIYVATGGGKEDFIADSEVANILLKKYKIKVVYDNWSNGKTISKPLIRESVNLGNSEVITKIKNGESISINSDDVSKYDALFTSDQRFYDYYKLSPDKSKNEADRYYVLDGGLTLNTPIVIYIWKEVVNSLIKEKIVTNEDGVYYITDMNKLIDYILNSKKWKDIGLKDLYGNINIASTDPVSSSPGATYYGLLLSILSGGEIKDATIETNLKKLKVFYQKSGYMNNTPADLFERYLKTGMGGEPMIVDYEKSIIDFANSNPTGFNQVKDDIVVLYPKPTIWNSHCLTIFSENGKKLLQAFEDEEISKIAWDKYGVRTGVTGTSVSTSDLGIGIPSKITSTVTSLKMNYYNELIEYLSK